MEWIGEKEEMVREGEIQQKASGAKDKYMRQRQNKHRINPPT
jgi:hypothetical protein